MEKPLIVLKSESNLLMSQSFRNLNLESTEASPNIINTDFVNRKTEQKT